MFLLSKMGVGLTPPIKYIPASATVSLGDALVLVGGEAVMCGATVHPEYIAVGPAAAGEVPAIKVEDYMSFETTLSVDGAALKVGDKVTIHNSAQVTATTESGVAKILDMEGTGAGDRVRVCF